MNTLTEGGARRRGIALVIVLGMLALMMLLGVAFSVFMRTERLAAGTFKNDVRVRNLLSAGVHRAIVEVDSDLIAKGGVFPSWDTFASLNGTESAANSNVWSGFEAYIPRTLLAKFKSAATNVYWQTLPGSVDGRYAYIVINCSGLIDANHAGGSIPFINVPIPRALGTNANEIQLDQLPEVVKANLPQFYQKRDLHYRYESLPELGVLQTNNIMPWPQSLVVYSRFPTGYLDAADAAAPVHRPEASLAGDAGMLSSNQTDIVSAFVASGFSSDDANAMFHYLLDYVDPDCVPGDLGTPTAESVPMINEVMVTNSLIYFPGGKIVSAVNLNVEWFYPFVKSSPNGFDIKYDITIAPVGATPAALVPPAVSGVVPSGYLSGSDVKVMRVAEDIPPFQTAQLTNTWAGQQVQFDVRVGLQVLYNGPGGPAVVDSVPYPYAPAKFFQFTTAPLTVKSMPTGVDGPVASGKECIDPRFNWDPADILQWVPYVPAAPFSGSLNETNAYALDFINLPDQPTDHHMDMFVADEPIRTLGELSYILRGATAPESYWNTLRLVDDGPLCPLDPVVDHFYLDTNSVLRGVVNPNTRSVDVLKAVFQGMPADEYPGDPSAAAVGGSGAPSATALANEMIKFAGSFTNRSDLGHLTSVMNLYSGATRFEKESLVRNCVGLFHPRQNYFIVAVAAQATEDVMLPNGVWLKSVRAAERAVAEVWRDPYPKPLVPPASGVTMIHPAFVRLFKILEE